MSEQRGLLIVVSGPAGSGKGTVLSELLRDGGYRYSVSATTRAPRQGEVDGVNYHFLSREAFEARIAGKEMLEYTEYCGNYYGTPRKEAEEVLASGQNLLLEIEVEGAANVKREYPEAVSIMLLPPSFAVQEKRLRGRGTETEEKIRERLLRAREEILHADEYDYVIYNHDGKSAEAVEDIRAIVRAERAALRRNPDVVKNYFA
ncbi:MAG: guanylate kinase [Ruminococcaceae bacterium]|nr:guanylate kinase [Oscillospiraceae bacterium]